jgi:hypothetical protein
VRETRRSRVVHRAGPVLDWAALGDALPDVLVAAWVGLCRGEDVPAEVRSGEPPAHPASRPRTAVAASSRSVCMRPVFDTSPPEESVIVSVLGTASDEPSRNAKEHA